MTNKVENWRQLESELMGLIGRKTEKLKLSIADERRMFELNALKLNGWKPRKPTETIDPKPGIL